MEATLEEGGGTGPQGHIPRKNENKTRRRKLSRSGSKVPPMANRFALKLEFKP